MMAMQCDQVRDLMPELLAHRLSAVDEARVQAHIAQCDECRAEMSLGRAIAARRYTPAVGLEARVLAATANRRIPYWSGARMTLAASIAIALIGGSVLLAPPFMMTPGEAPVAQTPAPVPGGPGFLGVDDAFASGAASLNDLSVEELRRLLAELDS